MLRSFYVWCLRSRGRTSLGLAWKAGLCLALFSASFVSADAPSPPGSEKSQEVAPGLCSVVGRGGVGESGASLLLHHRVTGKREIVMVVRNNKSSLCGSTGAIAVLVVNGEPVKHGNITDKKSSIQASAKPGDHIIALFHTIPLFNTIACIRLGELEFTLEQCDLE